MTTEGKNAKVIYVRRCGCGRVNLEMVIFTKGVCSRLIVGNNSSVDVLTRR